MYQNKIYYQNFRNLSMSFTVASLKVLLLADVIVMIMNFGYKGPICMRPELATHLHLLFLVLEWVLLQKHHQLIQDTTPTKLAAFVDSVPLFAGGCGYVKLLWFAFECSLKQGKIPLKITEEQNQPCSLCQETLLCLQSDICLSYQCHLVNMSNISVSLSGQHIN